MANVLIVDDDKEFATSVSDFFKRYQFNAEYMTHGHLVIDQVKNSDYQLIILDKLLGECDGAALCQEIRTFSNVPIIMLTGISDIVEHVIALESGADDYITKPFSLRTLLARVRALLKFEEVSVNLEKAPIPSTIHVKHEILMFENWQLNKSVRRLISPEGVNIPLSGKEYQLLLVFLENPSRILTREYLLTLLDKESDVLDRAIDMLVSRVRSKIQDEANQFIQTVRQGGYLFNAEVTYSVQDVISSSLSEEIK